MKNTKQLEEYAIDQVEQFIRDMPDSKVDFVDKIMIKLDENNRSIECGQQNKVVHKVLITMVAAVILLLFTIGSGFISPTMAQSLKQIPGMSGIFQLAGDLGLKAADEKGLTTKLSLSDSHDDLTLHVSKFVFDGTRVSLAVEFHGSENQGTESELTKTMEEITTIEMLINGKPLQSFSPDNSNSIGIYQHPGVDPYSAIIEFSDLRNQGGPSFPEQFDLTLNMGVAGIEEAFRIDIPIEKNSNDHVIITQNVHLTHDNVSFTLKKLELTPVTTNVHAHLVLPNDWNTYSTVLDIGYDVVDDKGNKLKLIHAHIWNEAGDNTFLADYRFQPVDPEVKRVTIKPYVLKFKDAKKREFLLDTNGHPIIEYIPELEVTISLEQ